MAIDNSVVYPGQSAAPDANYPQGSARNITVPSDGTGFPLEQTWVKDWQGFFQKILADAPVVPSGSADTVLASDYMDGMQVLFLNRSELSTEGGDILEVGNRLTAGHRDGLITVRDSGSLMTTSAGSVRNQADTADLILPAALQKDVTAAWAVGDGNGGLAEGLAPVTQDMYRMFVGAKPDGTTTTFWDTSPTAANFFAGANAIAAGYSDSTLFRRFRWVYVDGTLTMPDHTNVPEKPWRYEWAEPNGELNIVTPLPTASRGAVPLEFIPPECNAELTLWLDSLIGMHILVTSVHQSDVVPSITAFSLKTIGVREGTVRGFWQTDSAQQVFFRSTTATVSADGFIILSTAWEDYGLTP